MPGSGWRQISGLKKHQRRTLLLNLVLHASLWPTTETQVPRKNPFMVRHAHHERCGKDATKIEPDISLRRSRRARNKKLKCNNSEFFVPFVRFVVTWHLLIGSAIWNRRKICASCENC